jgi:ABC-type branched-chain amino acid transport system, permease component
MTVLALPESMATTKEDIMSESIVLHDTPLPRMPPRSVSLGISGLFLLVAFTLSTAAVRLTQTWQLVGVFLLGAILAFGGAALAKRWPPLALSMARERQFLLVGALFCAALYPWYATDPYQVHVVAVAGIFALMAIGLNVTTGYAGLADFGFIVYYAIGAYTSALLSVKFGWSFWLTLPAAALMAALLSIPASIPAIRVRGHYLALVTLGYSFIVIQLITNLQSVTGGTQGVSGIAPPSLFGHSFQTPITAFGKTLPYQANFYYLVLVLLTLAIVFCARLSSSRWGRTWAAMRSDEVAANSSGLRLPRLKLMAFAIGASLGGAAGAIYAHMVGFIDPSTFRIIDSVFLLAIVAIGNWRIGGVIASALLFTILPEKLRAFEDWRLLIFGSVLLIVMLLRGRQMVQGRG